MFLGEMGDSVLDIKCHLLSGLGSPRAKIAHLCMYSLDMLGKAIHLFHSCHGQTQVQDRTGIKRDPRTRKGPEVQLKKARRRVRKEMMGSTRLSLYTGPLRLVAPMCEVRGFATLRTYSLDLSWGRGQERRPKSPMISTPRRRNWRTGSQEAVFVAALLDSSCDWPR